jgi:hypothetical protein
MKRKPGFEGRVIKKDLLIERFDKDEIKKDICMTNNFVK